VGLGALFAAHSKRGQIPYLLFIISAIAYLDLFLVDKNFIVDAGRTLEEMYGEDEVISLLKQDQEYLQGISTDVPAGYGRDPYDSPYSLHWGLHQFSA
jgi:hypothetical protein